jgi:signal transduction histidine kinase
MEITPTPLRGRALLSRLLGWRRLLTAALAALVWAGMLALIAERSPFAVWVQRTPWVVGAALLAYGALELWPRRLPRWAGRWAVQLMGVVLAIPPATLLAFTLTLGDGWTDERRQLVSAATMAFMGVMFCPWLALGAMVRQREALAQAQALAFELERSELARQALDARLRLVQAQVEPHFLFNTLANVRALVATGSPRAAHVLDSLIAYLRAAVPRLHEPATTLGQELDLVRAYLELMHLRMPDRLQWSLDAEPATLALPCPPTTLLTLVENAVRHGIDPAEDGGRIEVRARVADGWLHLVVQDSGVGLGAGAAAPAGLGTGLAMLRERLALHSSGRAALSLQPLAPHGARAEVLLPVLPVTALTPDLSR